MEQKEEPMKSLALFLVTGACILNVGVTGSFAESAGSTGSAISAKDYVILPVPQAEAKAGGKNTLLDRTVKNPQGKTLGTLEKLVMDSATGKIEYGVVSLADSGRLVPLNWSDFRVNREKGRVVLNATKEELQSSPARSAATDLSPDLWEYFDDIVRKPSESR
jgi:sporulation protein YlmC with PRC-barrel domain